MLLVWKKPIEQGLKVEERLEGLKEAAKIWFDTARSRFKLLHLVEMKASPCVFQKIGISLLSIWTIGLY